MLLLFVWFCFKSWPASFREIVLIFPNPMWASSHTKLLPYLGILTCQVRSPTFWEFPVEGTAIIYDSGNWNYCLFPLCPFPSLPAQCLARGPPSLGLWPMQKTAQAAEEANWLLFMGIGNIWPLIFVKHWMCARLLLLDRVFHLVFVLCDFFFPLGT